MSKGLSALRDNHQVIYKGALFVLAIGLIVYLFPKEGKFKYEFQKGKPWLHENLIAPFDFAIIKSQDQIDLERSEVLERIDLYFVRDQNVSKEALISFRDQFSGLSVFDSLAPPRRDALLATAESLLEEVYEAGIVRWPESIAQEEWEEVRLLNSGVAEDAQTGKWFNIRSASQKIDERVVNSDWTQEERKVIVPLLLESLDYTIFYDGETTEKVRQSEIDNIALTRGMVQRGQSIILRGEVVDEDSYQKLNSLKNEFESNVCRKAITISSFRVKRFW